MDISQSYSGELKMTLKELKTSLLTILLFVPCQPKHRLAFAIKNIYITSHYYYFYDI